MGTRPKEEVGSVSDQTAELVYSRLNTRENSTLTIATVASSASLVLIGLAKPTDSNYPLLAAGGVLFPLIGLLYREVTILTVDHSDLDLLGQWVHWWSPPITAYNYLRRMLLRLLLTMPVLVWFMTAPVNAFSSPAFVVILFLVIALTAIEAAWNDPLKKRR
jgi:hypothetical protein